MSKEEEEIKNYMEGYRFLRKGEVVQENDEKWDGSNWKPVVSVWPGNSVHEMWEFMFRRKVKKKRVG